MEHYDERLESWGQRNIVVDLNVGPKGGYSFGDSLDVVFDRHFDDQSMIFSVRNDSIDLQQLTDEVIQVGHLAESRLKVHRFVR